MRTWKRFAHWLSEHELSGTEAAELLGYSTSTINKVAKGDRRPGIELALRIEDATRDWEHGPIAARDWVEAA